MTTYLTIDSSGARGNNGYKTAKEDLMRSGNSYKNPTVAERIMNSLFGSIEPLERVAEPFSAHFLSHYIVTALSFRGNLGRKSV